MIDKPLAMANLAKFKEELNQKPKLRSLFWEATSSCNLSCKHCGSDCSTAPPVNLLTTTEICNFFSQLANDFPPEGTMLYITGGEPLLRPDLFQVMAHACNLGFVWGITTNGTLLTDKNIQQMVDTNCKTLSISLDGLKETHDDLRGHVCFDEVIAGIKKLVASKAFAIVQVTTVVHKKNIHQLDEIHQLLCAIGIDSWRLTNIDPIGRANFSNGYFLDAEDFKYLLSFIKDYRQIPRGVPVSFGCSHFTTLEYERDIRNHYFCCGTGILTASILHNGDIFVCPNVERRPDLIQGSIRTDRFADVWKNDFKAFRVRRDLTSPVCSTCEDAYFCMGDSTHTWDYDNKIPRLCLKKLL